MAVMAAQLRSNAEAQSSALHARDVALDSAAQGLLKSVHGVTAVVADTKTAVKRTRRSMFFFVFLMFGVSMAFLGTQPCLTCSCFLLESRMHSIAVGSYPGGDICKAQRWKERHAESPTRLEWPLYCADPVGMCRYVWLHKCDSNDASFRAVLHSCVHLELAQGRSHAAPRKARDCAAGHCAPCTPW